MNCLPSIRSAGLLWNEILAAGADVVTKSANASSETTYLDAEIDFSDLLEFSSQAKKMDAAIIACFEESCLVLGAMTKLLQQTRAWLQALCLAAEAAYADKDVDSHTIDTLHPVLDAIRSLGEQLSNQQAVCAAAVQDALPIYGAFSETGLVCRPASAETCSATAGSHIPDVLSAAEALQRPRLGLVRADSLQLAVEVWRLHPYFDTSQWIQSCDVLHELLVRLGAPKSQTLPDALVSFPELLQSVNPDDFGKEFAVQAGQALAAP